eukprot:jgi/Tetstr1/449269/TSEL_036472.t1
MDIQQLVAVLQHCMSPNPQERTAAEQSLSQFQYSRGQIVNMLRLSIEEGVDEAVRQVASISFKNSVKQGWEADGDTPARIGEEDKAVVRSNLLEAIVRAPSKIKSQLGECLKSIVYTDYPEKWPDLLQSVVQNLTSQEQPRMHGALYAMRILARKYEFKDEVERAPIVPVIENSFPTMLHIFQAILAEPSRTVEMADLVKLMCKTFWSCTFMSIPACLNRDDQFVGWMTCLHSFINMPVPTEGQPEDLDLRVAWPWWKAKKWVLHITNRLFNRYSDPKGCDKPEEAAFAGRFAKECVPKFLEAVQMLLVAKAQGQWLPPRVVNLLLQFMSYSVSRADTYKLIKPHMNMMLINIVFPILCFDDEDAELWENDPQEYIRKGYDIIEEMYNPRTAAMNMLHEVCKVRGKNSLDFYMEHVVRCFNAYAQAGPQPDDAAVARNMDGALLSMGTLYDVLRKKKTYKQNLERVLVSYVVPVFGSPWGHLRAKACWVSGMFCGITFEEQKHFDLLLQRVFACLNDEQLPVRMDAVVAVRHFVDALEDHSILKPILPQLLNQFFSLMNEVENEDLVMTLETIVEKFGDEIAPYAVGLCQNLNVAFMKMIEDDDDDDDDDGAGTLAAFGCLRAITTVLESMSSMRHLYPQLEEILYPMMYKMLSTDGQEVFEEVVEILSYFTYFSPTISPRMWTLWPLLHKCLIEWAVDYFDNILVPLDNFVNRDTETFLSNPDYVVSVLDMVGKVLGSADIMESEMIPACKLMEIVLQNCRGRVDSQIGPYIELALGRLRIAEKGTLKDFCVEVVANAIFYNPVLALGQLQQKGALQYLFATWFEMITKVNSKTEKPTHFKRPHDKKICILALVAILQTPAEALPQEVQAGIVQVFQGTVRLLINLKTQLENAKDDDDEAASDDDDDDDDDAEEDTEDRDDNEDEDNEDDDAYLRRLAAKAKNFTFGDDSDDDWTDDEEVQTPIDDIDPFVSFSDLLNHFQASDQQKLGVLTSSADETVRAAVQTCMQFAEQRRTEIAEEQKKAAAEASAA